MSGSRARGDASLKQENDPSGEMLRRRMARIEKLANALDSNFKIPFTGIRFGWDGLIGLVPGLGDVATLLPQLYLVYEGMRAQVPRRTLVLMVANVLIDTVLGSVPVLGDAFDLFFKSNRRNAELVAKAIKQKAGPASEQTSL